MKRLIFHVDVNSAFLSWEATRRVQRGEPDIRLVPSIIGGDPSKRSSIVAAKSIPAKQFGINTGEPVSMAIRKCPGLVVAQGDFALYQKCSHAFKSICKEYTPAMESFSIDEVFMDMTGMEKIYPDPIKTAYEIKDRIRDELGFTVNVGIGENKLCAKMASDFTKPDKVHTLFHDEIPIKMWKLPVQDLFGCGKSSAERLKAFGYFTIGDLANADIEELKAIVGEKSAVYLSNSARGINNDPVSEQREDAKGYSAETTVEEDLTDLEAMNKILLAQADVVTARMRKEDARCRCVQVSYRTTSFVNKSHQRKLPAPTDVTQDIFENARTLIAESWNGEPLRLIGLSITDIDRNGFEQISFIQDDKKDKLKKLDATMDSIRTKFGNSSVQRASTIDVGDRVARKYKATQEIENDRKNNN